MAVAHVPLDLRPGGEGGHGVHHHHIDGAGAHQCLADLQSLLAGVGLGDEHGVDIHPQSLGVDGIHGVLGIDESHLAAPLLRLGHNVEGQGGLTGGLRAVDLNDAPLGHAADAQGEVQGQRSGGDGLHHHMGVLPQAHHRTLAEILLDLSQGRVQRLLFIRSLTGLGNGHFLLLCHVSLSS